MKNMLLYDDFINENNINDNILNEGSMSDFKDKIKNWWSSFQNREEFIRKIRLKFSRGFYTIVLLYLTHIIFQYTNIDYSNYTENDGSID